MKVWILWKSFHWNSLLFLLLSLAVIMAKWPWLGEFFLKHFSFLLVWESNVWADGFASVLLVIFACQIRCLFQKSYRVDDRFYGVVGWWMCFYIRARFYDSVADFLRISFMPVVCWVDFAVALLGIAILVHLSRTYIGKSKAQELGSPTYIPDLPIQSKKKDALHFKEKVKVLMTVLHDRSLVAKQAFSIGINAPWGAGKTSLMNLLKEELKADKDHSWLIVDFNPRDSNRPADIQRDFLLSFSNVLKDRIWSFPRLMAVYIRLLNLDKRFQWITALLQLWVGNDAAALKKEIENGIRQLDCYIVVFIDDFDRLEKEEMLEVFKLIDKNASFVHTFFVTAYDKNHVNRCFNSTRDEQESYSSYTDKYFHIELNLMVSKALMGVLFQSMVSKNVMLSHYLSSQDLQGLNGLINEYLDTSRDVKRFVNLLAEIPETVWENVVPIELCLVTLLKYKFLDDYLRLKQREMVVEPEIENCRYYGLPSNVSLNSSRLLKRILPEIPSSYIGNPLSETRRTYKDICCSVSFYNYFWLDAVDGQKDWSGWGRMENPETKMSDCEELLKKQLNETKAVIAYFNYMQGKLKANSSEKNVRCAALLLYVALAYKGCMPGTSCKDDAMSAHVWSWYRDLFNRLSAEEKIALTDAYDSVQTREKIIRQYNKEQITVSLQT